MSSPEDKDTSEEQPDFDNELDQIVDDVAGEEVTLDAYIRSTLSHNSKYHAINVEEFLSEFQNFLSENKTNSDLTQTPNTEITQLLEIFLESNFQKSAPQFSVDQNNIKFCFDSFSKKMGLSNTSIAELTNESTQRFFKDSIKDNQELMDCDFSKPWNLYAICNSRDDLKIKRKIRLFKIVFHPEKTSKMPSEKKDMAEKIIRLLNNLTENADQYNKALELLSGFTDEDISHYLQSINLNSTTKKSAEHDEMEDEKEDVEDILKDDELNEGQANLELESYREKIIFLLLKYPALNDFFMLQEVASQSDKIIYKNFINCISAFLIFSEQEPKPNRKKVLKINERYQTLNPTEKNIKDFLLDISNLIANRDDQDELIDFFAEAGIVLEKMTPSHVNQTTKEEKTEHDPVPDTQNLGTQENRVIQSELTPPMTPISAEAKYNSEPDVNKDEAKYEDEKNEEASVPNPPSKKPRLVEVSQEQKEEEEEKPFEMVQDPEPAPKKQDHDENYYIDIVEKLGKKIEPYYSTSLTQKQIDVTDRNKVHFTLLMETHFKSGDDDKIRLILDAIKSKNDAQLVQLEIESIQKNNADIDKGIEGIPKEIKDIVKQLAEKNGLDYNENAKISEEEKEDPTKKIIEKRNLKKQKDHFKIKLFELASKIMPEEKKSKKNENRSAQSMDSLLSRRNDTNLIEIDEETTPILIMSEEQLQKKIEEKSPITGIVIAYPEEKTKVRRTQEEKVTQLFAKSKIYIPKKNGTIDIQNPNFLPNDDIDFAIPLMLIPKRKGLSEEESNQNAKNKKEREKKIRIYCKDGLEKTKKINDIHQKIENIKLDEKEIENISKEISELTGQKETTHILKIASFVQNLDAIIQKISDNNQILTSTKAYLTNLQREIKQNDDNLSVQDPIQAFEQTIKKFVSNSEENDFFTKEEKKQIIDWIHLGEQDDLNAFLSDRSNKQLLSNAGNTRKFLQDIEASTDLNLNADEKEVIQNTIVYLDAISDKNSTEYGDIFNANPPLSYKQKKTKIDSMVQKKIKPAGTTSDVLKKIDQQISNKKYNLYELHEKEIFWHVFVMAHEDQRKKIPETSKKCAGAIFIDTEKNEVTIYCRGVFVKKIELDKKNADDDRILESIKHVNEEKNNSDNDELDPENAAHAKIIELATKQYEPKDNWVLLIKEITDSQDAFLGKGISETEKAFLDDIKNIISQHHEKPIDQIILKIQESTKKEHAGGFISSQCRQPICEACEILLQSSDPQKRGDATSSLRTAMQYIVQKDEKLTVTEKEDGIHRVKRTCEKNPGFHFLLKRISEIAESKETEDPAVSLSDYEVHLKKSLKNEFLSHQLMLIFSVEPDEKTDAYNISKYVPEAEKQELLDILKKIKTTEDQEKATEEFIGKSTFIQRKTTFEMVLKENPKLAEEKMRELYETIMNPKVDKNTYSAAITRITGKSFRDEEIQEKINLVKETIRQKDIPELLIKIFKTGASYDRATKRSGVGADVQAEQIIQNANNILQKSYSDEYDASKKSIVEFRKKQSPEEKEKIRKQKMNLTRELSDTQDLRAALEDSSPVHLQNPFGLKRDSSQVIIRKNEFSKPLEHLEGQLKNEIEILNLQEKISGMEFTKGETEYACNAILSLEEYIEKSFPNRYYGFYITDRQTADDSENVKLLKKVLMDMYQILLDQHNPESVLLKGSPWAELAPYMICEEKTDENGKKIKIVKDIADKLFQFEPKTLKTPLATVFAPHLQAGSQDEKGDVLPGKTIVEYLRDMGKKVDHELFEKRRKIILELNALDAQMKEAEKKRYRNYTEKPEFRERLLDAIDKYHQHFNIRPMPHLQHASLTDLAKYLASLKLSERFHRLTKTAATWRPLAINKLLDKKNAMQVHVVDIAADYKKSDPAGVGTTKLNEIASAIKGNSLLITCRKEDEQNVYSLYLVENGSILQVLKEPIVQGDEQDFSPRQWARLTKFIEATPPADPIHSELPRAVKTTTGFTSPYARNQAVSSETIHDFARELVDAHQLDRKFLAASHEKFFGVTHETTNPGHPNWTTFWRHLAFGKSVDITLKEDRDPSNLMTIGVPNPKERYKLLKILVAKIQAGGGIYAFDLPADHRYPDAPKIRGECTLSGTQPPLDFHYYEIDASGKERLLSQSELIEQRITYRTLGHLAEIHTQAQSDQSWFKTFTKLALNLIPAAPDRATYSPLKAGLQEVERFSPDALERHDRLSGPGRS